MIRKKYVLLAFTLLFQFYCLSQVPSQKNDFGLVKGKIVDSTSSLPLEFVKINFYKSNDTTLTASIYSDLNGDFKIDNLPLGNYFGKIYFLGYTTKIISDIELRVPNSIKDLGYIKISIEKSTSLEEVKVSAKLDVLKTGIDKKIYNVAEDISSKGGSANDVLNKIPSVEVDQDGKIALRGDGNVTILIDGRPSSFSGANGKNLLDGIPASSIERIEVVTNPSAKYSPDGTSGIINIVFKKNKLKGTNGLISNSLATNNLINSSASFSFRNAKFNSYASYAFRYSEGYRNNFGSLDQIQNNSLISRLSQDRLGLDLNKGHTIRVGSDFYITSNQTLGLSIIGNTGQRNRSGDLNNKLYDENINLISFWNRKSYDPTSNDNVDLSINYKLDLKENKGSIICDFNQSFGKENIKGFYDESYYDLNGNITSRAHLIQQISNIEKNNVSTAQLDYNRVFPKTNTRIETGVKSIVRNLGVNTNSETFDTISEIYKTDTIANFNYSYNEQIYSFYGILGHQIGKLKYQGGLRFEEAIQVPYLVSTNEKYTNNYFKIYPSGHIKYNHTPNTELSLSYSRRVNRASSSDMNPFTNYSDPYNLRKGNPSLKPEFINSIDLGYSIEKKKVTLTSSVYYRYTYDVIQRVKIFYPNNTSAVTYANIDRSQSAGIEIVAVIKPQKYFKNVVSFNGSGIKYSDNTSNFNYNNSGFTWGIKYMCTIEYWKKTMSSQLNINYAAPMITAQGIAQRRGSIDFSSEKTFINNKWSIGARVTDIFNRQGFSYQVTQPTIIQKSEYKWLTRRVYLTISYKFGKLEMSSKKVIHENSGMDF